ncbi:MAG: hypothetical protein ACFFDN_13645 [Candidatus Hodarchaeota archaeon]
MIEVCNEHKAFKQAIDHLKEKDKSLEKSLETLYQRQIKPLWDKWDNIQKLILSLFVTLSLNLIGVLFILIRLFSSAK